MDFNLKSQFPKMKVKLLQVISAPAAGGAEIYVRELIISLIKKDFDPLVCFISRARDIGRSEDFEKEFLNSLDELGIKYFFLGHVCRKYIWVGIIRMWLLCRRENVKIYHTHLKYGIIFGAFLHIPRIYTHHNIVAGMNENFFWLFNALIDQYIGISKICSHKLSKLTGRVPHTIVNAVKIDKFQNPYPVVRSLKKPLRCICVGNLGPQKNYAHLINSVADLPTEVLECLTISIVGEGPQIYKDELINLINNRKLNTKIRLLGHRSDIPRLLRESDLFLMSSSWEGLPISLIEASASGLPFIATDVGGCREVSEICQNGMIVPPNDIAQYTNAINEIINNPDFLSLLSTNALKKVYYFDIERASKDHEYLYKNLLKC